MRTLQSQLPVLPLILAGPVLRRVEPSSVSVWIALKSSQTVTLRVYSRETGSRRERASGTAATISFGPNLHVAVVTAVAPAPAPLKPGELLFYNLFFGADPTPSDLNSPGILNNAASGHAPVSLTFEGLPEPLPSFALAPGLDQLRFLHASCRKAHGESRDALPAIEGLIAATAADPSRRPHLLFLTGDQIYADDVADALLFMLTEAGATLLGDWFEDLPGNWSAIGKSDPQSIRNLPPGARSPAIDKVAKFTANRGFIFKEDTAKSHLMSLGEFFAMYLFAWSNVVWLPDFPPSFQDVHPNRPEKINLGRGIVSTQQAKTFANELKALTTFRNNLRRVRRVLANVPTYMIFDDHEVTDDWYLDRQWCNDVLTDMGFEPLGTRILSNALSAYALFQAWGNVPLQFAEGNGQALLQNLSQWCASKGTDEKAGSTLRRGLAIAAAPGKSTEFSRPAEAVDYHFTLSGPGFNVLFLDTRTWRVFPGANNGRDLVELMSPTGMAKQFQALPAAQPEDVTIVISPAPLVGHPIPETLQDILAGTSRGAAVDPEHWGGQPRAFERVLVKLVESSNLVTSPRRTRVVLLSGDVHYGYAIHVRYQASRLFERSQTGTVEAAFALLTSSALKNEAGLTRLLHNHASGDIILRPERRYGWNNPGGQRKVVGQALYRAAGLPPFTSRQWEVTGEPAIERFENIIDIVSQSDPPQWKYRMQFVQSDEHRLDRVNFTPRIVAFPPPGDRDAALKAQLDAGFNHEGYRKWLQSGKRVVGVNNFGEVTFSWGEGEEKFVIQELWFWLPEQVDPFPFMRAKVPLSLATPDPPF